MVTTPKTETRLTLRNLMGEFLQSRRHLRPTTLTFYRGYLRNFDWYAQENGWPPDAGDITRDHIREFLSYIEKERNRWGYTDIARSSSRYASPSTVHHYGQVVKTLFT